jgi:hypothetical protein
MIGGQSVDKLMAWVGGRGVNWVGPRHVVAGSTAGCRAGAVLALVGRQVLQHVIHIESPIILLVKLYFYCVCVILKKVIHNAPSIITTTIFKEISI